MNRLQKQKVIRWSLVIINMLLIFLFSGQTGEESGELSGLAAAILNRSSWFNWVFQYIDIRKAAHFSIYFTLGLFTLRAVMLHTKQTKAGIAITVLICFLYACSDELHQSFIPGRGPSFRDVMIDTAGALNGIVIVSAISGKRPKQAPEDT